MRTWHIKEHSISLHNCEGVTRVEQREQDKIKDKCQVVKSLVFYHKINEKLMMYFKKEHNILWNHGFERNKTRGRESI